jgi:mono/diheme cytochrome c family protein
VTAALADGSPQVRAAAVRMAERWLREPGPESPLRAAVLKLAGDTAPAVRQQLAASLGEMPDDAREARETALNDLLVAHGDDPVLVDAAISSLKGREAAALERLLAATATAKSAAGATGAAGAPGAAGAASGAAAKAGAPGAGGDPVAMLAGAVMSAGGADAMAPFVKAAPGAPARPAWQRDAIKRGMDMAAPPSLADAGTGKPLTADEQKRFAAGQQVFQNLCIACHGPNGRGQEGLGPALAGSKWVTGRAGLTARIVLNGKEGEKMMPPLSMLTDDQVASVLTFVRRSWGHTASAVSPTLVREVRGASTGRTRPWTEAELLKLTQADGPPPRVDNEVQRDRMRRQGRQP